MRGARLWGLALALAALWLLWNTRAVYPLRILVTLLHESSHGLAAWATGGRVERITIAPDGSGLCWTRGGWRWVILPAGYLGSMLWGGLILLLALRTRWDKAVSLVLGSALLLVTLLYVRCAFGVAAGLFLGAALVCAGRWLAPAVNEALLTCIGSASCLYALFDIRDLLRSGSAQTDAAFFSREVLPLPPAVWAALWGLLALACLVVILRLAVAPDRTRT